MNINRRTLLYQKRDVKERLVVEMHIVNEHIQEDNFAPAIPETDVMAAIQGIESLFLSSIDLQHAFFLFYIKSEVKLLLSSMRVR